MKAYLAEEDKELIDLYLDLYNTDQGVAKKWAKLLSDNSAKMIYEYLNEKNKKCIIHELIYDVERDEYRDFYVKEIQNKVDKLDGVEND